MQAIRDVRHQTAAPPRDFMEILSQGGSGSWVLNLPEPLRTQQDELEALLGHVFPGTNSRENFALAQQMTINWCVSKFRKLGMRSEDTEWL